MLKYRDNDQGSRPKDKQKKSSASSTKTWKIEFDTILQKSTVIYHYEDESRDIIKKQQKMKLLHKLLEWIIESDKKFIENILRPNFELIIEMISANIFRALPAKKEAELDAMDEGVVSEEVQDKSWPTLIIIYEIFLHLVKHPAISESMLKHSLTESYIQRLLDLFETNNIQERDYLKQIVHKLYAKVIKRRKVFRKMFNNHFITLVHERDMENGVSEILDIYSSIISGFAVPLRPEHIDFFKHFLTPMLKVHTCSNYYEELLRCILIFLNKDSKLAYHLLETLLDFWPNGNTAKELGYLITIFESMDFITAHSNFNKISLKFFKRVAQCLGSEHIQIIDRTMTFFEKDTLLHKIHEHSEIVFPLIVPVIERQLKEHWHKILKDNFRDLKVILREADSTSYDAICKKIKKEPEVKLTKREILDRKWEILEGRIKETKPDFEPSKLPFKSSSLVSDYNELYSHVSFFNH
jgi:serine/threonine-protein phosphatase 2A regulatory subunit B'